MAKRSPNGNCIWVRTALVAMVVATLSLLSAGIGFPQYVGTGQCPGLSVDFYGAASTRGGPECMPPSPRLLRSPLAAQVLARLAAFQRQKGVDQPTARVQAPPTNQPLKAVCILVDFPNTGGTQTVNHFTDMLFSLNTYPTGSVRDYYLETSYQQLDISGDVAPDGATGTWYRMPNDDVWYAAGGYPRNVQKLVEDAINAANPGVNFRDYASGGPSTEVDLLWIVHAGPSAQADPNGVFSTHKWNLRDRVWVDGVYCYNYALMSEEDLCGGFAHETGHLLGAPDLYDYDSGSDYQWDYNDYPVNEWCIMAMGSWGGPGGDGSVPTHFCGALRGFYGWTQPTPLSTRDGLSTRPAIPVTNIESSNAATSLYQLAINGNEYFLIENRFPNAPGVKFDRYNQFGMGMRGGIIFSHIDSREPSGTGRFNNGSPDNNNYGIWVEDPGMAPDPASALTRTIYPPGEWKYNAAYRFDGVSTINLDNSNTTLNKLYPSTRDNQLGASNIQKVEVLDPSQAAMNIRIQFTPVQVTFKTQTHGTILDASNYVNVTYYSWGQQQVAAVWDAHPVTAQVDPGSNYSYSLTSTASVGDHQWEGTPAQAAGIIPDASPMMLSCAYYEEYQVTIDTVNTDATYSASQTDRTLRGHQDLATGIFGEWVNWCDAGTKLTFAPQTAGSPPRPAVGNRTWTVTSSLTGTVTYDAQDPTLTVTDPAPGQVISAAPDTAIVGTAGDDVGLASVKGRANGGAWQDVDTTNGWIDWTLPVTLVAGENQIDAQATDLAGKVTSLSLLVYYDIQPPQVTFVSPPHRTAYAQRDVTVTGTASDDCGVTKVKIRQPATGRWRTIYSGPLSPQPVNWTAQLTLDPGRNVIEIKAIDGARRTTVDRISLYYDGADPTIGITSPADGAHVTNPRLRVTGTAQDNIGVRKVELAVNTGAWKQIWSGRWQKSIAWLGHVMLVSGENVIHARATDMAGRTTEITRTVSLDTASGEAAVAAGLAIGAVAAQPTRAGGISCTIVLSAAATVRADVLNLAGRPVATINPGTPMTQGTNTLLWSGKSAAGLVVPSGTYLIRVQAQGAGGAVARGLATVTLQR